MQWQHGLSIGLLTLLCSCQNSDRPIVLTPSTAAVSPKARATER